MNIEYLILSYGCVALVGGMIVYTLFGLNFEHMYDLLKMATSPEWISYDSYERLDNECKDLKHQVYSLEQENKIYKASEEDMERRCEALQTKIYCLEAQQCREANKRADYIYKNLKFDKGDDLNGDN